MRDKKPQLGSGVTGQAFARPTDAVASVAKRRRDEGIMARTRGSGGDARKPGRDAESPAFGQWLRALRKRSHLGQRELGNALGYTRDNVGKIESGRPPSLQFIERLCSLLRLSLDGCLELRRFAFDRNPAYPCPEWASELRVIIGLDDRPHNLPAVVTSLIGREEDVDFVRRRLLRPTVRLVTLVGLPGIGKTRIATQVAVELLRSFRDGVCFVELESIREPAMVEPAVAQALGVREVSGRPLQDVVRDHVRTKQLLIVLDNFEHLFAAAPYLIHVLSVARDVKVLVTSRARLDIYGEHVVEVRPLDLPQQTADLTAEAAQLYPAVQLFVERAQAATTRFALDEHNLPDVLELCGRLDGIPLSIELAAAQVGDFSIAAIAGQLERTLDVLERPGDQRAPRLTSWRAALDWSMDLLEPDVQVVFARLAVFAGGADHDAIQAICVRGLQDTLEASSVEAIVSQLLRHHLIQRMGEPEGTARVKMLESIRDYATERLSARGEDAVLRAAHAGYFLMLAERAAPELRGPNQVEWSHRLELDQDNLRAALAWSTMRADLPDNQLRRAELAVRLAGALWWFWFVHGSWHEGRRWFDRALAATNGLDPRLRLSALYPAGHLAWAQTDYESAVEYCEQAVPLARSVGDKRALALSLGILAHVAIAQGDFERVVKPAEEVLQLFTELDDSWGLAMAHAGLGAAAVRLGDYVAADQHLRIALQRHERSGDIRGRAEVLNNLGIIARVRNEIDRANGLHEQALALFLEVRDHWQAAAALNNLGIIASIRGGHHQAAERHQTAADYYQHVGDQRGVATSLEHLSGVFCAHGRPELAAQFLGTADAIRQRLGSVAAEHERAQQAQTMSVLRDAIGDLALEAAVARGQFIPADQALELTREALSAWRP